MSNWVRIDTKFPSHPKVLEIGPLGEALWLRGLCYAGEHLTDGFVPVSYLKRMADMKAPAIARRLVDAGLWEECDGGYQIHGYLDWQRSRDEVADISSKRAEAGRRGGRQKSSNLLANGQQTHSSSAADASSKTLPDTDTDTEAETETLANARVAPKPPGDFPDRFDEFWAEYPKGRGSKRDAAKLWDRMSGQDRVDAIRAIPLFKAGRDWREGFHPAPEVWLRGRRWENPPELPKGEAELYYEAFLNGAAVPPTVAQHGATR